MVLNPGRPRRWNYLTPVVFIVHNDSSPILSLLSGDTSDSGELVGEATTYNHFVTHSL